MPKQVYLNLPVANLPATLEFFTKLGFQFNSQFASDVSGCMIVDDNVFVMLLTHERFKDFIPHGICDAHQSSEVLICLSANSREEVDEMVRKAVAAGGKTYSQPQDHGFMYGHGFQDLDGHIWELAYMDMSQFPTS